MTKTKIHPDTQLVDASYKRTGQSKNELIRDAAAKSEQKIRCSLDGSQQFCKGKTKFPCTDASESVKTAGLMQSSLVQPAALQCALKKKKERMPWDKFFRFGRRDSELLAVFIPEDLNALYRKEATNPKAKGDRKGRRSKS